MAKHTLTAIPPPALTRAFEPLDHQKFVRGLNLAGSNRVTLFGETVVVHACPDVTAPFPV